MTTSRIPSALFLPLALPAELSMVPRSYAAECLDYGFALGQREMAQQISAGEPVSAGGMEFCAMCGGTRPTCCKCPDDALAKVTAE